MKGTKEEEYPGEEVVAGGGHSWTETANDSGSCLKLARHQAIAELLRVRGEQGSEHG